MYAIKNEIDATRSLEKRKMPVKMIDNIILRKGPATDIFPVSSRFGVPNICTAPGAANKNPVNTPRNNASNKPQRA